VKAFGNGHECLKKFVLPTRNPEDGEMANADCNACFIRQLLQLQLPQLQARAITAAGRSLPEGALFTLGANPWKITYTAAEGGLNGPGGSAGQFINLTGITAIPEPGSLLALGGLLGVGLSP